MPRIIWAYHHTYGLDMTISSCSNKQVAVSLSLSNSYGSVPLGYRMYLRKEWTEERARCRKAAVPQEIEFRRQIAREDIERALADNTAMHGIKPMGRWMIEHDYEELKSELGLMRFRFGHAIARTLCSLL